MLVDLGAPVSQAVFGEMVGVSQPAVSEFLRAIGCPDGASAGHWLLAYCERLREVAAGRGYGGDLDLAQERAALAREQRIAQEIKNAVTRREYAPVDVLATVLAQAAASVAAKLDSLPALLKKLAPDLPDDAREALAKRIAEARNEWVRDTSSLDVQPSGVVDLDDELVDDDVDGG